MNKVLTLKHRFRSSAIEIPDAPIGQACTPENVAKHEKSPSFADLLHSYYENASDPSKRLDNASQPPDQSHSPYEEAPHFDIISNDLDVTNILDCSQKLLKSVTSTLKRVQVRPDATLLGTDIIDKYSDSVESLAQSVDECHDEAYLNEMAMLRAKMSPPIAVLATASDAQFDWLDVNQLPRAIIKRWFREIVFAVKHLHSNGVLCYDLQPNNLLLGKSGEVLLTYFYRRDFNPYYFDENMQLQCYSSIYIAPERPLTTQSDVWSIGVLFYELLTGYSFRLCHPESISTYFEIQYPDDVALDAYGRDLIEKVRN